MITLLACVAEPPPASTDDGVEVLVHGPTSRLDPDTDEPQSHPTLIAVGDGWLAAWDVGSDAAQRTSVARLDADLSLVDTLRLATPAGAGFSTPDLAVDAGGTVWSVVRVDTRIEVRRLAVDPLRFDGGPTPLADGDQLGFWTAPDLAPDADGLRVGWWDGALAPGAAATYRLATLDRDLRPIGEVEAGRSSDTGSPLALAALPDGRTLAVWSDRISATEGALWAARVDAAGTWEPAFRVDDVALPYAPDRPAIAVDIDGAFAIGWRAQDERQVGAGVRVRRYDADGTARGPSIGLGFDPERTNRIELAAASGRLIAVFEEATADLDVMVEVLDFGSGDVVIGATRVHDQTDGVQERPHVSAVDGDRPRIGVVWESEGAGWIRTLDIARF